MNVEHVAARIRAEFDEMPGMTLTMQQASRLFGLDTEVCRAVVDRLVGCAFLRWTRAGVIVRGEG